jgi:hypothetical protein
MAADDDKPEPKVKELLERDLGKSLEQVVDEVTAAQLARWFELPSFQQVEEGEVSPPVEDPEMLAVRERRAKAIAAVDPEMVEAHRRRMEAPWSLIKFEAKIDVHVDPDVAQVDYAMAESRIDSTEPREVERPEDIEDHLRDNTPQALLRDLHRPEIDFQKEFEVVDMAAEQKVDIVELVREAITTNWKLPDLGELPGRELHRIMADLRAERESPWGDIPKRATLPNRRVED